MTNSASSMAFLKPSSQPSSYLPVPTITLPVFPPSPNQVSLPPLVSFPPPNPSAMAIQNRSRRMVDIIQEDLSHTAKASQALDSHISYQNVQREMEMSSLFSPASGFPAVVAKEKTPATDTYKEEVKESRQCSSRLEAIRIVGVPLSNIGFTPQESRVGSRSSILSGGIASCRLASEYVDGTDTACGDGRFSCVMSKPQISQHPNYTEFSHRSTVNHTEQDRVSMYNLTLKMKKKYDMLRQMKPNFWDQYQAKLKFEMQRAKTRHADIYCSRTSIHYLTAKRDKMKRMGQRESQDREELPQIVGKRIPI